jgi:hypothetical protein
VIVTVQQQMDACGELSQLLFRSKLIPAPNQIVVALQAWLAFNHE